VNAHLTDVYSKRLLVSASGCDSDQASKLRKGVSHAELVDMNLGKKWDKRLLAGAGGGDFVHLSRNGLSYDKFVGTNLTDVLGERLLTRARAGGVDFVQVSRNG
jgi:hypothetical protein